jgi:hypothetical protein
MRSQDVCHWRIKDSDSDRPPYGILMSYADARFKKQLDISVASM